MKRKPPLLDKRYPRQRALSQGEKELWRKEMGEIVGLHTPDGDEETVGRRSSAVSPSEGKTHRRIPPKEKSSPHAVHHMDKPTLAKIRRGASAIEARLDLHGHNKHQAFMALLAFIARAKAEGLRLVLVITGKGREGAGTLRRELPRWLNESPLREAIIAYDEAGIRHGGEGALYVRIRKSETRNRKPEEPSDG